MEKENCYTVEKENCYNCRYCSSNDTTECDNEKYYNNPEYTDEMKWEDLKNLSDKCRFYEKI